MIKRLVYRVLFFIGNPFFLLTFWVWRAIRAGAEWILHGLFRLWSSVGGVLSLLQRQRQAINEWLFLQKTRAQQRERAKTQEKKLSTPITQPSHAMVTAGETPLLVNKTSWKEFISYDWLDQPRVKTWRHGMFWRGVAAVFVGSVIFFGSTGWWIYKSVFQDLPSILTLETRRPAATTRIYDRNGELLYKVFEEENRTPVALNEISPYLVQATLAIEDTQYYEHWGVSLRGITRAAWHNFQSESTQGGSTITQQLVKNTLLNRERTWRRKIREAVLAVAVDARYSKEQILEWYLNDVNYGGAIYGSEEAAQWYFGKSARDLSLAESALLAGLPNAPTLYNPFGAQPERAFARQREVLRQMEGLGFITSEQRQTAESQPLAFRSNTFDIQAPHFVMMVRDILAQQYGEEVVAQGGLEVWTTLDLDLQASAEAAVRNELQKLGRLRVGNGAAMVTDPRSGEVLAMVGSQNYFDTANDGQVNVALSLRQPGSSIKPLGYALAFEKGWTPSSTIEDSPVQFTAPGAPVYAPRNYDGRFRGSVTLREALASSYNIPAVRLLADVGISTMVQAGQRMGITTWNDPSRFGLALALGGGEVRMYDMAQVYGTFANGGETVPLNPILEIRDVRGDVMYKNPCQQASEPCNGQRVLKPLTAAQITDVLSDNAARSPAFGSRSALVIPDQEVAVKTGTTNSLRDNWTIGYTRDRVVLTWVGNNDNSPMSSVASGVTGASPIWNSLMSRALNEQSHRFALPAGMERVRLCATTGTLACAGCPRVIEEVLPLERIPKRACSPSDFAQASMTPAPVAQR